MDCSTARMLLEFDRPLASELDAVEHAQLESHLSRCEQCSQHASDQHRFDDAVGEAMRQVAVPERLQAHLLTKLEADRSDYYRRWYGNIVRIAVAAGLVLFAAWAVFLWHDSKLPVVDLNDARAQAAKFSVSPESPEQVEDHFHNLGVPIVAPRDLDYTYLMSRDLVQFQGQLVPQLIFVRHDESKTNIHAVARVLILPSKKFDLEALPKNSPSQKGYKYKMLVSHQDGQPCAYLIYHTGKDLSWLRPTPRG